MGKRGKYERTPEIIKKQSEARIAHFDEVGRKIEVDQRTNPREYQLLYQREYRKTHKEYFRAYAKKKWLEKKNKKNAEKVQMTRLNDAQNVWNEIVTSAIANEYNKFEKQTDIMPLVNKLHEMLIKYASEVKDEKEKENTNECVSGSCKE